MKSQNFDLNFRPSRLKASALVLLAGSLALLPSVSLQAQSKESKDVKTVVTTEPTLQTLPQSTHMDLPGDFHKYYGQRVNDWVDTERKIAKVWMKMDLNHDGSIQIYEPEDQGEFKSAPPGMTLGVGEMTKAIIRVNPYRVNFEGDVIVSLEVAGINRGVVSGEYGSFQEEVASTGHIRVWRDVGRHELLLDSADPNHRLMEWFPKWDHFPYNLPNEIPRVVWVEGVGASPKYLGDLRLLVTVSNRPANTTREQYKETRLRLFKAFRTTFDHILLTVTKTPMPKEFINHNAENVWWSVDGSGAMRLEEGESALAGK